MLNAKKKTIPVFIVLLIVILALGFYMYFGKGKNEKNVEYMSASWAYNYSDVEEMAHSSDLIALVTVQDIESVVTENSVPYTTYSVKVDTPIYNSESGEVFSIFMTGGETDEKIIEIEDDPLLQPGDEILVFCKENADGTYRTLSGSQGRLIYEDGKINSLNAINTRVREANSYSNIMIQGTDAEDLIAEIKGYVGGQ